MPLIVLDRDGVINFDSPEFIKTADEWRPIPGSIEAIARLSQAGWQVYVASNQSGIGRGLITPSNWEAMNAKMSAAVTAAGGSLAGLFFCPHTPEEGCDCRKPKPGLLRQIESAASQSLAGVPVVGDSQRDLDAAVAVGAQPMLVLTGNGKKAAAAMEDSAIPVFDDLGAVADTLVKQQ